MPGRMCVRHTGWSSCYSGVGQSAPQHRGLKQPLRELAELGVPGSTKHPSWRGTDSVTSGAAAGILSPPCTRLTVGACCQQGHQPGSARVPTPLLRTPLECGPPQASHLAPHSSKGEARSRHTVEPAASPGRALETSPGRLPQSLHAKRSLGLIRGDRTAHGPHVSLGGGD